MKDVIERSKNIFVTVSTPTGDEFQMSAFEYSRWLALMNSIQIIDDGAKRMKIDLDDNLDWIQPIAIEKFIKESYGDILNDLMTDKEFLNRTTCTTLPDITLK